MTRRLAGKDNFVVDTVKYIKKEVGAFENKVQAEVRSIAITGMIFGGAIGIVVGIVGTALWEKYMTTPPAPVAQRTQ